MVVIITGGGGGGGGLAFGGGVQRVRSDDTVPPGAHSWQPVAPLMAENFWPPLAPVPVQRVHLPLNVPCFAKPLWQATGSGPGPGSYPGPAVQKVRSLRTRPRGHSSQFLRPVKGWNWRSPSHGWHSALPALALKVPLGQGTEPLGPGWKPGAALQLLRSLEMVPMHRRQMADAAFGWYRLLKLHGVHLPLPALPLAVPAGQGLGKPFLPRV